MNYSLEEEVRLMMGKELERSRRFFLSLVYSNFLFAVKSTTEHEEESTLESLEVTEHGTTRECLSCFLFCENEST